ncbi:MAG TPA: hypothetical protein VLA43_00160, partial [Longimicrobiales bacterium]|nr:hypothetical protein [Longimicrobiales bacterium]
ADAGEVADGVRILTLRTAGGEEEVRARVVVDAAGLAGIRRVEAPSGGGARIGVGAVFPAAAGDLAPGWIHMFAADAGYVGVVRQEDGTLDVAGALDPDWIRRHGGPARAVEAHLERAGGEAPRGEPLEGWRGTPPLTWRPASVAEDRLFRVGDAAGYVEPFTGEGMAWALGGAALLAPLLDEAARGWWPGVADRWARIHAREIAGRQRICRSVARLSRHPYLSREAIRWSGYLPRAAALMAGALARPFPLTGLSPGIAPS